MKLRYLIGAGLVALTLAADATPAEPVRIGQPAAVRCTEDMSCWNCHTMGNKRCGNPHVDGSEVLWNPSQPLTNRPLAAKMLAAGMVRR